eukprot:scaffold42798_cov58-Cyclotella_meneghiniana.AAC.2
MSVLLTSFNHKASLIGPAPLLMDNVKNKINSVRVAHSCDIALMNCKYSIGNLHELRALAI